MKDRVLISMFKKENRVERGLTMGTIPQKRTTLLVLVMGCALTLLLSGCGKKKEEAVKPPPKTVVVARAVVKKIPIEFKYSGTVKAIKSVDVVPRVTGFIEKRFFEEGSLVEKGEPLYLIDPRPFKAKLEAAQAQLKMHRAMLTFWKSEAARYRRLAKKGAASLEKMEGALAKMKETMAAIEKDRADIALAKLELSFTNITAPISGRVQQTNIHEGNLVRKNVDVLTSLVQMDPIQVVFSVGRKEIYGLQLMKSQGKLLPRNEMEVRLILPDGSTYSEVGRIDFVSSRINPATDTVTVRSIFRNKKLANADYLFIPGQYTPVKVTVGYNPHAVLVPAEAVIEDQTGTFVMVVGKENKVERRKVEEGPTYKGYKVISKGLKEGEIVITKGVQKVKTGMEVKPTIEAMEPPPSAEDMEKKKGEGFEPKQGNSSEG